MTLADRIVAAIAERPARPVDLAARLRLSLGQLEPAIRNLRNSRRVRTDECGRLRLIDDRAAAATPTPTRSPIRVDRNPPESEVLRQRVAELHERLKAVERRRLQILAAIATTNARIAKAQQR